MKGYLFEAVDKNAILKALRGRRYCSIREYTSNVPGYGSVSDERYGVILCLGYGRYGEGEDSLAIRFYQNNHGASWGYKQKPRRGSEYKIMYLKDIAEFHMLGGTVDKAPALFNSENDKWFREVIEIANFGSQKSDKQDIGYRKNAGEDLTDTEKEIERTRADLGSSTRMNVSAYSKTNQERYREVKVIANKALNLYNKYSKSFQKTKDPNDEINAKAALETFRDAHALSNKYMAIYKKEQKTSTEKNIKNKFKH